METLNEYCLSRIFDFLRPLDWIHVSQVCSFWKDIVSYQWKKKGTEIGLGLWFASGKRPNVSRIESISVNEAKEMIRRAAPFAKVLKANNLDFLTERNENHVRIGQFCYYRVESFPFHRALKLVVDNVINLTELHVCEFQQDRPLYERLFEQNAIKKVFTRDREAFYEFIPTDKIEDLDIYFKCSNNVEPFQGHFENLQTLRLQLHFTHTEQLLYALEQTLPYVFGIKKLHIEHSGDPPFIELNFNIFERIYQMWQLEELTLELCYSSKLESETPFIRNLMTFCPQLKSLNFGHCIFSNSVVQMLMRGFPNLESLSLHPDEDFCPEDIPEMKSLTHCHFCFISVTETKGNVETAIESLLEKMPKLQRLEMYGLFRSNVFSFAHRAIIAASSMKKDIILSASADKDGLQPYWDMKVERKRNNKKMSTSSDEKRQTLFLKFEFGPVGLLFNDILKFVDENMKLHHAFLIENENGILNEVYSY